MCVIMALCTGCGDDGDDGGASIAEARDLSEGTEATVEGFVTVAPGTFASATFEQGFAIQSGDVGIYVTTSTAAEVVLGDEVQVTGKVLEVSKLTALMSEVSAVEKLGGNQTIEPRIVATGSVNEDTEGQLIKVSGTVTKEVVHDSPYGFKVFIDDDSGEIQLFIHLSDSQPIVDLSQVATGDKVEAVGMSFQYEDTYEVNPRGAEDFSEVAQ